MKKGPTQAELENLIQLINTGRNIDAETKAHELSKLHPKANIVWKILGVARARQGRTTDAIPAMQKATQLEPKDAEAQRNLAHLFQSTGNLNQAEIHFSKAITLNPQDFDSSISLAKILHSQQKYSDSEKVCKKFIAYKYDSPEVHFQLGLALLMQKKPHDAESSFRTTILLAPSMVEAHNHLGISLNHQKKYAEAENSYRQAIHLDQHLTSAYCNLAFNSAAQDRFIEAEEAYRKAIEINPGDVVAMNNLGIILQKQEKPEDAKIVIEKALSLNPQWPHAHNTLGNIYKDLGDIESALEHYKKAITISPTISLAHYSNYLLFTGYHAKLSPEEFLQESIQYGKLASAQAKLKYTSWLCKNPNKNAESKIRIGFVSGDFRRHAVASFLENMLRHFDKDKFELIAYPSHHKEDDITELLKPHFIKWQPIHTKSDLDAAKLIHQDAPHILFDLSGHSAHNRLPMFAYKPAPIQVTWAGYPATTGLPEMDYILGDKIIIPSGSEHQFTEKVCRFPEIGGCFSPLIEDIPTVTPPVLANGYITFGCFNNLIKMNDNVVATWAKILLSVPNSKLHLQSQQLSEESVIQSTYRRFAIHGIIPQQLILEGKTSRQDYFRSYNRIDIALDPFPRTGGTTSADTLWMGVPVLTLKGYDYWSRLGESITHCVEQSEWIADSTDDYINKAIFFAGNLDYLTKNREILRDKVIASPLFDAPRFARNFEKTMLHIVDNHYCNINV